MHGGPVAQQEWERAKKGKPPKYFLGPDPLPSRKNDEAAPDADAQIALPALSLVDQIRKRIGDNILLLGCEGDIYRDGWIGPHSIMRLRATPATPAIQALQANFYVPGLRPAKTLIATIRCDGQVVRRTAFSLRSGKINTVAIGQVPRERNFDLGFSVVGCDQGEGDIRWLGAVLVELGSLPSSDGGLAISENVAES